MKAQLESTETFTRLLVAVASVSLLVGGIGIMNVASVTERTREIGLRLAVGATPGAVLLQFLAKAVLLSIADGAAGLGVSVAGSSLIGRAVGWSLSIPVEAVVVALLVSSSVGVFFGFLPARRAASMDPIEALRAD